MSKVKNMVEVQRGPTSNAWLLIPTALSRHGRPFWEDLKSTPEVIEIQRQGKQTFAYFNPLQPLKSMVQLMYSLGGLDLYSKDPELQQLIEAAINQSEES